MRQAHFARVWKRAATEQTNVADGVMWRTKGSGCDKGLFGVEQPSNAVNLGCLDRFFERQRWGNCWDPFGAQRKICSDRRVSAKAQFRLAGRQTSAVGFARRKCRFC